jgi:hypothetical protein
MDEADKKHARSMCYWRLVLRGGTIIALSIALVLWTRLVAKPMIFDRAPVATSTHDLPDRQDKRAGSPSSAPPNVPAAADNPPTPSPAAVVVSMSPQASKKDARPQKAVKRSESPWVQAALSVLPFGANVVVLMMLVWGIVAVVKHDD